MPVVATLGSNPTNAQLVGHANLTAADGYAAFQLLTIRNAGEGYTIRMTCNGVSVETEPFDVLGTGI